MPKVRKRGKVGVTANVYGIPLWIDKNNWKLDKVMFVKFNEH